MVHHEDKIQGAGKLRTKEIGTPDCQGEPDDERSKVRNPLLLVHVAETTDVSAFDLC